MLYMVPIPLGIGEGSKVRVALPLAVAGSEITTELDDGTLVTVAQNGMPVPDTPIPAVSPAVDEIPVIVVLPEVVVPVPLGVMAAWLTQGMLNVAVVPLMPVRVSWADQGALAWFAASDMSGAESVA